LIQELAVLEAFGLIFSPANLANLIPNLRLSSARRSSYSLRLSRKGSSAFGAKSPTVSGCGHSHTKHTDTGRKTMRAIATMIACAAAATTIVAVGPAMSEQREIVIGIECDRTGPTQIVGVNMCPGYQDYINLVNSRGGVEGYKIKGDEIDNEYKVPPAVEAYQRQKAEGAVSIMLYGTPQTQALTQRLNEDKIPGTSPGFGTAAAANGARYPYLFPIAATYWTQGAAGD
jgi:ABC-type branched-subunit amino acid transport system substrate-binding protein